MKRIFLLKGLDCPNCSAKIEKEVGELDGVQSSVVNLMKQTLTINVTQTAADTIASQIETIVYSHEPDVEVQEETVMNVTKSYSLKGLDCPNCSAKIEKEVGELDGTYILFPFTTVKMVTQLLFVAAIFVHIFINIRPLLVSLGIISYKERRSDIYLILSVLLLFIAGAVILYYIGWQYL